MLINTRFELIACIVDESSILAFSAASRIRWIAILSCDKSIPCFLSQYIVS